MRHTTDQTVRTLDSDLTAPSTTCFSLPAESVCVRSNGIEFQSATALPLWTEVMIEIGHGAGNDATVRGLVVGCSGCVRTGHRVAVLFIEAGPVARHRIAQMCGAQRS